MDADDLDPVNAITRDVYAHFGLAYYLSECVHRALVEVYAILQSDRDGTTRPMTEERRAAAESEKMTLGDLVSKTRSILPVEIHDSLDWALAQRNHLAHGFWYERIHMMSNVDDMRMLIEFLTDTANGLRALNQYLDNLCFERLRELGVSDDMLAEAMEESRSAPPDPSPPRRPLKSNDKLDIVEAWIAPGSMLVLKDREGELWQLSDVGLGWSFLEPNADWKPCKTLADFLPAQVAARPKGASQWKYALHVSTGARIRVRRNPETKIAIWYIERIEKKSGGG